MTYPWRTRRSRSPFPWIVGLAALAAALAFTELFPSGRRYLRLRSM
jgi:hypothetical protein